MDMVLKYDPEADILERALFRDERLFDSDVVLGFDEKGELVALEVWDYRRGDLLKTLKDLANKRKEKSSKPYQRKNHRI